MSGDCYDDCDEIVCYDQQTVRIGATVQLHVIKLAAGGSQQSHLKFEFIEGYVTFGRLSVNKLKSVMLIPI
jgi:hypothetical protein